MLDRGRVETLESTWGYPDYTLKSLKVGTMSCYNQVAVGRRGRGCSVAVMETCQAILQPVKERQNNLPGLIRIAR